MNIIKPTKPIHIKTEKTDTGCLLYLQVPDNLYYFDGHFPELPVLAGVCQLDWVINAIETYCGNKLSISAMEAIKFHHILSPGEPFLMEISFDADSGKWIYNIFSEDKTFASGRLTVDV